MAEINLIKLSQSSGGPSLVDVNFNGTLEGQADTTIPVEVNLTDGVNPVVPTSVALTGNDLDIVISAPVVPSGVLLQFPTPSQYTSYRTGDVGDRVQNGWFDYTPPSNPAAVAELDYTSANYWYLLKNNLVVGGVSNKTRFVDVDGGQTFSATGNKNLILIDKLTGIGIYRPQDNSLLKASWNAAIDDGLSLSIVVNSLTYDSFYLMSGEEFFDCFGFNIKANNWIDPISSITLLPTTGTGSQLSYLTSSTPILSTTVCLSPRFTNVGFVDLSTFPKNSINGRPFYIFDARNLITAP
jgi:hypothetical protein